MQPRQVKIVAVDVEVVAFNSLFEMPLRRHQGGDKATDRPFNSLFEMLLSERRLR